MLAVEQRTDKKRRGPFSAWAVEQQPESHVDSCNGMIIRFAHPLICDASQGGLLGLDQCRHGDMLPSLLADSW